MLRNPFRSLVPALAGLLSSHVLVAQYATGLVEFQPGSGRSPALTNATAVLGEPSRITPGDFGGPVDPFSPPYAPEQLVSIGTGGSLTVRFDVPIRDNPLNPHGLDFSVFGSGGFLVTNDFDANFNYIGTPATDGTLFNPNSGSTRVRVSPDGTTWYTLDPALAPTVDDRFPTDGSGDFGTPIPPSLRPQPMGGLTLSQVRALYGGSGGGAAFDLAWARDDNGASVSLGSIQFVRIEVLTGRAEIDGFAAVTAVPEPGAVHLMVLGALAGTGWAWKRRNATQAH
jgi:hypothetical protein